MDPVAASIEDTGVTLNSRGRLVTMRYKMPGSRSHVKFRILFTALGCGGIISSKSSGSLKSYAYPRTFDTILSEYFGNSTGDDLLVECLWTLDISGISDGSSPENLAKHVDITLTDVDLLDAGALTSNSPFLSSDQLGSMNCLWSSIEVFFIFT